MGKYIRDSEVLNRTFDCRYINLSTSGAINEIGKNPLRKISRYFFLLLQIAEQMVKFRPDLYYLTPYTVGRGFYKDALIVILLKLTRKKIVFHLHNKGVAERDNKYFDQFLYRRIFRNINTILLSEYLYDDLARYLKRDRVYFCANGVPETKPLEHIDNDGNTPQLLFLSNLIRSKGIEYLIEACSILRKRDLKFRCIISGSDGDLKAEYLVEKIKEKGLESIIALLPPAYGNDKQRLLSAESIFVHPSFNDCMPLVLIEAMQHSLPVVSTFEGAIPDVVDDGITGILVKQKDSVALANAIEKLIRDPQLRQELGIKGYEKYREHFTIGKFESRLMEILIKIGEN